MNKYFTFENGCFINAGFHLKHILTQKLKKKKKMETVQ